VTRTKTMPVPKTRPCRRCKAPYPAARAALGYTLCMPCGEKDSRTVRHCIVPLHKSAYTVITDRRDLHRINNKT